MKKKEWYELLNQYNELIEQKSYNAAFADAERLTDIKKKIEDYIETSCKFLEAELAALSNDYAKMGLRPQVAKENIKKSWYARWAHKGDKILQSIQNEAEIDAEHIEDSYYEVRWYGGRLSTGQLVLLLSAVMVIALLLIYFG